MSTASQDTWRELASGRTITSRPPPHCINKEVCKRNLKVLDIDTDSWEGLGAKCTRWGSTLTHHLKAGGEKLMNTAADTHSGHTERSAAIPTLVSSATSSAASDS